MIRDLLENLLSSIVYNVDETHTNMLTKHDGLRVCQKHTEICKYHIILEILVILEGFIYLSFLKKLPKSKKKKKKKKQAGV